MSEITQMESKFIESKPKKLITFVKGHNIQEKEDVILNRISFLENNYCLYKNDKILFIVRESEIEDLKLKYNNINKINFYESLLMLNNNCVEIKTLLDITKNSYIKDKQLIKSHIQQKIIEEILPYVKSKFKRVKILDRNIEFFIEEIRFIKSTDINLKNYIAIPRPGRNLRKNSSGRDSVYLLFEEYNKILKEKNYYDYEDYLNNLKEKFSNTYSHVIINHGEDFSLQEIRTINNMVNINIPYCSCIISVAEDVNLKLKSVFKNRYKTINFKKDKKKIKVNSIEIKNNKVRTMEKFKYIDFRHKREYDFERDYLNSKELFLNTNGKIEVINNSELKEIIIYNDIAAGEPILMVDENEGVFNLPNYLLKGIKNCFMLKVKGDSMIGANINDGDYVIIRQQFSANSGEIVAAELDGSATLKRFIINKKRPFLMAENPKYEPINLIERQGSIIGIAIGVVKNI